MRKCLFDSQINSLIEKIDNIDPWILEVFKVEGPGEGVVWYPISLEKSEHISPLAASSLTRRVVSHSPRRLSLAARRLSLAASSLTFLLRCRQPYVCRGLREI